MHKCSKKLVTYKEYSCFDHSDFPTHSMFKFSRKYYSIQSTFQTIFPFFTTMLVSPCGYKFYALTI